MTDRELRERARAVIPGGMYGHQAAPGPAYPQFMRGGRGARGGLVPVHPARDHGLRSIA